MRKWAMVFLSIMLVVTLSGCGNTDKSSGNNSSGNMAGSSKNITTKDAHVLIAYFTVPEDVKVSENDAVAGASIVVKDEEKMGNTEYVARLVQETVGGDLFRIETKDAYPLEHDTLVDQAAEEQEKDFRPELSGHVENFERYDTVILGFPNWWGDLPMPMYSFLEEYDFGAKTIIPFVTHGGSGFSGTLDTISELQPGANVSDNTLSLSRDDVTDGEEEVREWAEGLGLNMESTEPESSGETVGTTEADPKNQQTLYLWEEGNAPAITEYTENNGNYADEPDFRPTLVTFPVPEGSLTCCFFVKGGVP